MIIQFRKGRIKLNLTEEAYYGVTAGDPHFQQAGSTGGEIKNEWTGIGSRYLETGWPGYPSGLCFSFSLKDAGRALSPYVH